MEITNDQLDFFESIHRCDNEQVKAIMRDCLSSQELVMYSIWVLELDD